MIKIFPTEHFHFYKLFDGWRKEHFKRNVPTSGVYILYMNKPINRLIGRDEKGILYIGKGAILEDNNRIGKLINAINDTEKRHDGGVRFNLQIIKEKYPIGEAEIKITLTNDPKEYEKDLLEDYLSKHGELPPLNRILG